MYRRQVKELQKQFEIEKIPVFVGTVDSFQGAERRCIHV